MDKKKIIHDLNKIVKSKTNKISPADKKKIRNVIQQIEKSKNPNWDKIISRLAKIAGIVIKIINRLRE
jgi:hypothetical protein